MAYSDVSGFVPLDNEGQDTTLFEHYFVASVFTQLCSQWEVVLNLERNHTIARLLIEKLKGNELPEHLDLESLVPIFARTCDEVQRKIREELVTDARKVEWVTRAPLRIVDLVDTLKQIGHTLEKQDKSFRRIGLFLDSFDYYQRLGRVIAPLLQSDSSVQLVCKIASRTLDVVDGFAAAGRRLELDRDFQVLSLDRSPDNKQYHDFVRAAIVRRVRKFCGIASSLSDGEIIELLCYDSSAPEDGGSFESLCSISSGNLLSVYELIDTAAQIQRYDGESESKGATPLERRCRISSIKHYSDRFWNHEIGERMGPSTLEAETFCDVALSFAPDKSQANRYSPRFVFDIASERSKTFIPKMLANRVLIAVDPITNRNAQAGLPLGSPVEFELNRGLLPVKKELRSWAIESI